jgi:hypothetical protein
MFTQKQISSVDPSVASVLMQLNEEEKISKQNFGRRTSLDRVAKIVGVNQFLYQTDEILEKELKENCIGFSDPVISGKEPFLFAMAKI